MWMNFTKAVRELRRTIGEGCGSYRPDLYYMRGPGPKWHAKHDGLASRSASGAVPAGRALHNMAERHV
jgi:hypothetical protein